MGTGVSASTSALPFTPAPLRTARAPSPSAVIAPSPTPAPFPTLADEAFPHKPPQSVLVPILLYHRIRGGNPLTRYSVTPERFEEQLEYLASHHYRTITIQDLLDAIQDGAPLPDHPVILTFDDGNQDVMEEAYPRMRARQMVGVVYVVGNRIGAEGFLDAEDLRALRRSGWEIGSHGMTHLELPEATDGALLLEIEGSKAAIESALGEPVHSFAYPFGLVSDDSQRVLAVAGYTTGAGLGLVNQHRRVDLFYLSRREVRGDYDMEAFRRLLGPS